jgi:hypothetical protein
MGVKLCGVLDLVHANVGDYVIFKPDPTFFECLELGDENEAILSMVGKFVETSLEFFRSHCRIGCRKLKNGASGAELVIHSFESAILDICHTGFELLPLLRCRNL